MLLLGIDEAGKGPVIGSMFVAGLVIDEENLFQLAAIGVKDSKQLPADRREVLSRKITGLAYNQYILEVPPRTIDELRQVITMNEIMVQCFAQIIQKLSADKAILDAADVNAARFAQRVRQASHTSMEIAAEHKADQRYHVVSAASILAKARRDRHIRDLERTLGCKIGSGYPTDPQTLDFLSQWIAEHGDLPPFARHSWATAKRIKARFI